MRKLKRGFSFLLVALCLCTATPGAAAPETGAPAGLVPTASQISGRIRRVQWYEKGPERNEFVVSSSGYTGYESAARVEAPAIPEAGPVMQEAEFTAYAYCACTKCCGKWARGITASGTTATEGRTIAVDPDVIPLGTHVYVNGREYIAEDTGSGINNRTIDVFFNSHQEALQWGQRTVTVTWPAE